MNKKYSASINSIPKPKEQRVYCDARTTPNPDSQQSTCQFRDSGTQKQR